MGWSRRTGRRFGIGLGAAICVVFLTLSLLTGNWHFFLGGLPGASASVMTGFIAGASRGGKTTNPS